jgi:hypothetical protein
MDLKSTERCRVFVEVRSKGLLGALEHHLIFSGAPDPFVVGGVGEGGEIDVPIEASVAVAKLAPPPDTSSSDRERMLDNIRSRDVLDAAKWPTLSLRGRYRGTLESGTLAGDLVVRGMPRAIALAVRAKDRDGDARRFDASWQGTQTELGIKPFRAMLGALQLRDWIKIRLEVELL